MGAGSLLALMARHSLLPVRQHSKLVPADIPLIDCERPTHVNHAHLAEEQPHCQLLGSFHLDLAARLQQLQLQGIGNAHLNWLLDALASTLSTHSSLQSAIDAIVHSSSGASLIAKHRADEVLHMLDVCTALKQVADDMDRHFGCLQHSLQGVGQALKSNQSLSSGRLHAAAHRLSACLLQQQSHPNVLSVAGKQYRPLAEARSSLLLAAKSRELQSATTPQLVPPAAALLSQALDGTMLTSLLALAAAVSSLEPPSPRKCSGTVTRACKVISKYLGAKGPCIPSWAPPLRQLRQDLREEDMTSTAGGSLFRELQGLHSAATKLHAKITPSAGTHAIEVAVVKQSVESLGKSLRELQLCTSMLRVQLATFFQALIALRLTLLNS